MQKRSTIGPSLRAQVLAIAVLSLIGPPIGSADDSEMMASYAEYLRLYKAERYPEALAPALRTLEIAERDLPITDKGRGVAAYNLGSLYLKLNRPADAIAPLAEALESYDARLGPKSKKSLSTLHKLADTQRRIGHLRTAERLYVDLAQRLEDSPDEQTAAIAGVYGRLRRLAVEMESKPRVKRYGIKAINAYTKANGPRSIEVGVLSVELGRNAIEMEDYDWGFDLFEHGVPILESHLEITDPKLLGLYEYLVSIYEASGDTIKHRRYRKRLKKGRKLAGIEPE